MVSKSSHPKQVDISLSQGMKIRWEDEHESQYSLAYLRESCPCATCRAAAEMAPQPGPFPIYKPAPKLDSAETVGHYALRLLWTDGHSTGIYSFDYLREICPCTQCSAQAQNLEDSKPKDQSLKNTGCQSTLFHCG